MYKIITKVNLDIKTKEYDSTFKCRLWFSSGFKNVIEITKYLSVHKKGYNKNKFNKYTITNIKLTAIDRTSFLPDGKKYDTIYMNIDKSKINNDLYKERKRKIREKLFPK